MSVTINGSDGITTPSLEVDSTTLVVDEVNNRVGIGTSSPTVELEVDGQIKTTDSTVDLRMLPIDASNVGIVGTYSNDDLVFNTNSSEKARIDTSGNLKFNSGYGSVATAYGVRAWVNFNGQGTPSIRGSGNVSSITDITVGEFSVNFATAMPDTNFGVSATTHHHGGVSATGMITGRTGPTATQVDFYIVNVGSTAFDPGHVYVAIHR